MNSDASPLRRRLDAELDALRRRGEFRSLASPPGIDLSSNDYLGLAADPRLVSAAARAIATVARAGSAGSRLLAGNSAAWQQAEAAFAAFIGAGAALHFSSGYAANLGLLAAILRPGDVVFSDALNHASLIDGIRLSGAQKEIYPHADLAALEAALQRHANQSAAKLIVTESLFSMEGDAVPLPALLSLARRYGADLIVDEAHALGVLGPRGRGLAAHAGIERDLLAAVYPCGKALGSAGAFVCCGAPLAHYLVNRARTFIFSTAPPPHLAHQLIAAVELASGMDAERAHLENLSRTLRDALRAHGFDLSTSSSQIVPVILGTSEAALAFATSLREDGFSVRAIRPPTVPAGRARVRLSLTARLTLDDIDRLLRACLRARDRALASTPVTLSEAT